jgi:hypothetical protein
VTSDLDTLRRWQSDAVELLVELAEHFDNFADCEIDADGYHPNAAMRFQVACEQLIERARTDAREILRAQLAASVEKESGQ